jgi:hypothetical protein
MPAAADQPKDRRLPSVASYSFAPDPERLQSMLAEVEGTLSALGDDCDLQRNVLVLLGEIVSRLLRSSMEGVLHLDLEIKRGTIRIDIWQEIVHQPCALLGLVDDPVLCDLAWASGNDRRRLAAPGSSSLRRRAPSRVTALDMAACRPVGEVRGFGADVEHAAEIQLPR